MRVHQNVTNTKTVQNIRKFGSEAVSLHMQKFVFSEVFFSFFENRLNYNLLEKHGT